MADLPPRSNADFRQISPDPEMLDNRFSRVGQYDVVHLGDRSSERADRHLQMESTHE